MYPINAHLNGQIIEIDIAGLDNGLVQIEGDAVICTISGGNVDADMFQRALQAG